MFPHVFQLTRLQRLPSLAFLLCLFALIGCSLFPGSDSSVSISGSNRSILQPIMSSPDAMLLEIYFIERPSEDPLLASEIWKEIDEHGDLQLETLETLHDNGFRIGHFSSNPPPASVQKLIGMVAEIPSDTPEFTKPIMGRHTYLRPGVESEITTGIEREECEFLLRDKDGTKTLDYQKVQCIFRMKAYCLQDGWVRVDFQPEIHHGARQMRRIPTDQGLEFRSGQNVDPLLAQRFSVKMNVGETMMVTATPDSDGTLGDRFFCQDIGGTSQQRILKKQRVLLIRLIDSGKPRPSFAK